MRIPIPKKAAPVPKKSRPRCRSEIALDKMEKGPYTFRDVYKAAEVCDRYQDKDGMQAGDSLDDIAHKFPPHEFSKLLHPKKHLSEEEYKKWVGGTDNWKFEHVDGECSNAQLVQVVGSKCFEKVVEHIEWNTISPGLKLTLLKEHRDSRKRLVEGEEDPVDRDRSPDRE